MIDHLRYSTISQIYVKDLIFYQADKEAELAEFCERNGISLLPAPDRKSCYQLQDGSFYQMTLTDEMMCNPYDLLFDAGTLAKFEYGNHDEVMFVMESGKIKGVVHIVDYNNDFIYFQFYQAIYQFEKMLRGTLHHRGERNDTLLAWMDEKGSTVRHWNKRYAACCPRDMKKLREQEEKRRNCGPFQTFYLNDLLYFIADREYVSPYFSESIIQIRNLRNWVAHSQDLAHMVDSVDSPLYRIDDLKKFVRNANRFFKCYDELDELVRTENIPLSYLRNDSSQDSRNAV